MVNGAICINNQKQSNMRVITHDGKEGVVVKKREGYKGVTWYLVKYGNGKLSWHLSESLTELKADQPTKPPSRAHDHLLLTIQTIEGMHKTASESKTDFAQGAEMAYSLVLDMLNKLK
jgi:hypothetical protein